MSPLSVRKGSPFKIIGAGWFGGLGILKPLSLPQKLPNWWRNIAVVPALGALLKLMESTARQSHDS